MLRPCFLVVDREQSGNISTRKLVIETAKFNVITAYSSGEALEALAKFPNVDGVVLDAGMKDMSCSELIARIHELRPELTIVVVGNRDRHPCEEATHHLDSFEPKRLLSLLEQLNPQQTAEIMKREAELAEN